MAKAIPLPAVLTGLEQSASSAVSKIGTIKLSATVDPAAFNKLSQPLGKITGLATEFEKSIAASNARVLAFGASVGILNTISKGFKSILDNGIEVEKSLANIGVISGQSADQLSKLGDALFDVAKNTSQSFNTAAKAALEFSRQGLSVEETVKRTNDALTLTRFTSLSASEAVDTLTAAVNSFAGAGITTTEILNKLIAVDSAFAVSAEDLANGLSRAGSIAQEVGVNFDELNGLITVTQEKTARGGAVIGNALKTIFTRIRSEETVKALRSVGVESLDAAGELKDVIPILTELGGKIKDLSGGERIQILEAVASKYNINILSALLGDIGNAESQFTKALGVSLGASNEAILRQIELNKTLDALLNKSAQSAAQLSNNLAEIGANDSLKSLVSYVNSFLDSINGLLKSDDTGGDIARGIIKGFADVLFKVGLPIIAAIFIKLTKDIATFGIESLQTILGINQQVKERQNLEQAVNNTLISNKGLMDQIFAASGNQIKQEEILLKVYQDRIAALETIQSISTAVTPALQAAGLAATPSGVGKKKAASGYLPTQEAADIRRGVGGASSSSKVVSIPNFAFGGGKRGTMIANTSEYIVPNFANGGSAIFNQDMVKSLGLPAGAKKISAAGGFVPNFAKEPKDPYAMLDIKPTYGASKVKMVQGVNFERRVLKFISAPPTGSGTLDIPPDLTSRIEKVKKQEIGMQGDYGDVKMTYSKDNQHSMLAKLISFHGLSSSVVNATKKSQPQFDLNAQQPQISNSTLFYKGDPSVFKKTLISATLGQVLKAGKQDDTLLSSFDEIRTNPGQKKSAGLKENYSSMKILANVNADEILDPEQSASRGYVPNFAKVGALEDAIKREMDAGLDPSQIRVTSNGKLKTSKNPSGLAVINTRDEPDGKIPNFAGGAEKRNLSKLPKAPKDIIGPPEFVGPPSPPPSAAPSVSPEAAAKAEADKKAVLTTNKLMSAFGALTIASYTLQSTLKDSDSGFGKFLTGLSQVGSTTAGFGSVGNIIGSALESRGGFLGKAAGYMGPAGMALGAGIGIYQAIQQPREEQLTAARGEGSKQAAEDYKDIVESIEEANGQQDALNNLIEDYKEKLKDINAELKIAEKGPSVLSAAVESYAALIFETNNIKPIVDKFAEGSKNDARRKEVEDALAKEQQKLKEQEERLKSLRKSADNARKKDEAARKKAGLLDKDGKPVGSRVALEARSVEIGSAFAKAKLANDEKSFEILKYSLEKVNEMNDAEARRLSYSNQVNQQEREIQETKKKNLEDFINQLKTSSAIAGVDEKALKNLEDRLAAGEDLRDVVTEITALDIKGSIGLSDQVKLAKAKAENDDQAGIALLARLNITNKITEANFDQLNVSEQLLKFSQQQESSEFKLNEYIKERIKLIENIKGSSIKSNSNPQSQLNALNAEIAGQFRPTASQTVERTRLTDQLNAFKQRNDLVAEEESLKTQRDRQLKEGYSSAVSGLNINAVKKNSILAGISGATTQKEYEDLFDEAVKFAEQKAKTTRSEADATAIFLASEAVANVVEKNTKTAEIDAEVIKTKKKDLEEQLEIESRILEKRLQILRAEGKGGAVGRVRAIDEINAQAESFSENFSYNTTLGFRDGLRDALDAAVSGTDDLRGALEGVAKGFLRTMQQAFLQQASNNVMQGLSGAFPSIFQIPKTAAKGGYIQKFAAGGMVTGGSGIRDDVPAMLSSGEYVMRKSAVQKYGAENMAKMNNGGIFLPGVRGGSVISGYDQLSKFANQTTTSGATDVLKGQRSAAFANLEDQSVRLSRFGLMNEDEIKGEITSAQQQGLELIAQREAYRTQQRKAMQQQIVGTALSLAINMGTSALGKKASPSTKTSNNVGLASYEKGIYQAGGGPASFGNFTSTIGKAYPLKAYGGMIAGFNNGGGPTDDIPALLMGGEYVMDRATVRKYGKQYLDSMNSGRAKFAEGGYAGAEAERTTESTDSKAKVDANTGTAVNISINVSGGNSSTESQGQTSQGGVDYKKMSERIKAVVLETLNEEKRLGGSLRTR